VYLVVSPPRRGGASGAAAAAAVGGGQEVREGNGGKWIFFFQLIKTKKKADVTNWRPSIRVLFRCEFYFDLVTVALLFVYFMVNIV
jgi:hypothetical protein